MKSFLVLAATLFYAGALGLVEASHVHDLSLAARHSRLSRQSAELVPKSNLRKRCKTRTDTSKKVSLKAESDSEEAKSSTTKKKEEATTTSTKKAAETPKSNSSSGSSSSSSGSTGLINVKSSCGNIGAKKSTSSDAGPNGDIDWLNCGINNGGWKPPYVRLEDLKTVDLGEAVKSDSSPFKACKSYISMFEKYGEANGIPPIIIASFAMQESSCNPETVGGAGEQGLMQLTKDKCGGAPGRNCRDPDFNIRTGAKFFKGLVDSYNGNVLEAIGSYNGWQSGMTYDDATRAAYTSCCRCQNNLDYLHQFLNGWAQNINAYDHSPRIGKYFNLDKCH